MSPVPVDLEARAAAKRRLVFALDFPSLTAARPAMGQLAEEVGVFKVGLELFVREGAAAVAAARAGGTEVFLDLKLHDIPETVERAVTSAVELGARYLTVHAAGGPKMLERAAKAAAGSSLSVLAVTVLTSLDAADLSAVGVESAPPAQVERLARLAVECGVSGLVCSAEEVGALRTLLGPSVVLVTPGIRPAGTAGSDDQKRVATPERAIADGASLLVVGRPIRDAADRVAAARAIVASIGGAL